MTSRREGDFQPIYTMNLQYAAMIKDCHIIGFTLLEIYSQIIMGVVWYYITQRGSVIWCPASVILLGEGEKRLRSTIKIIITVDPQKTWRYFDTWHLFLL